MGLTFGTGTTVRSFIAYREWLRVAEDCGFALLTTGDSQSLWADPFVSLAVAASETTRPRLGLTVSNPVTRHPAVVASSLAALQDLSGGRVAYGISSGDSALRNIGERPATVDELREFVVALRDLTETGSAVWRGRDLSLRWTTARTPIWLAAEGPRTQRLAGELADGVVLSNCLTAEAVERARTNIGEGARAAGRSLDDLELWWMVNVVPAATEAEGIESIRSILAGTANHVFRFTLEGKGVPDEHRAGLAALQREYDSRHHASPETAAANAALVDKYGLTEWLARQSTVAGPIEHCVDRLHEIAAAGVTRVIVAQFLPDQLGFMRLLAERVLPELGTGVSVNRSCVVRRGTTPVNDAKTGGDQVLFRKRFNVVSWPGRLTAVSRASRPSTLNVMVPPTTHSGIAPGPTTSMLKPTKSSLRRVVATAHRVAPMNASTFAPGGSRPTRPSEISPANPTTGPTPPSGEPLEKRGRNLTVAPLPGHGTSSSL